MFTIQSWKTSFLNNIFAGALEKGGVGALELVAMDMKARLLWLKCFCKSDLFFKNLLYNLSSTSDFQGNVCVSYP